MRRSTLSSARLLPKSLEISRSSTAGGADADNPTPPFLSCLSGIPLKRGSSPERNWPPGLLPALSTGTSGRARHRAVERCRRGQRAARQRRQPQQPAEAVDPVRSPAASFENFDGIVRGDDPVRTDGLVVRNGGHLLKRTGGLQEHQVARPRRVAADVALDDGLARAGGLQLDEGRPAAEGEVRLDVAAAVRG